MAKLSSTSVANPNYWKYSGIENEITFKAVLSGGKGGQNVNKVSTKVELYWNPSVSVYLTEAQKATVAQKLNAKINAEGILKITCEEHRSQLMNKNEAFEKLYELLAKSFFVPKRRIDTKPTKNSVKKRLKIKSITKNIKAFRAKPSDDEE